MMSLKPRNIDFQETWEDLKKTVAGVVALQSVERCVWNTRFSDVYALCVAHPEPLADRLYDETKKFLEEHVEGLLTKVRGGPEVIPGDHNDGLLDRYVDAWLQYSQGVAYLNSLYSYLNLQHVKRQKISDAEIIYGSSSTMTSEQESRQLEVGELGLVIWERVLIQPLAGCLSRRVASALSAARAALPPGRAGTVLTHAIRSMVDVQSFRVRNPLGLYKELVLDPFLEAASIHHSNFANNLLQTADISNYMKKVLEGLVVEMAVCQRFLHASSTEAVRGCYEQACVRAHLSVLHAHAEKLLREEDSEQTRADLRRMYSLLRPLGALAPLVECARAQAERRGLELLQSPHTADEAHTHFVNSILTLHEKYSSLFADVFSGAQAFMGALDKACATVVNSRPSAATAARAPELLARYCDCLLRRRGGDAEADQRLSAAILVFKYIYDKDVFQKFYARALARRLIHHASASMEQEEAMINRLKAACGYEFTNKLHRMFTDVAVSADLNAKFQAHLRDNNLTIPTGFFIQVLQAGAWPLGGAMAPLAPPAALEAPARLFEQFYRELFSGRRLAWLHHLCTGELRTKYTKRVYHVSATTPQCGILLCFETTDQAPARDICSSLQLTEEAWPRHLKPLVEAGLLTCEGDCEWEGDGTISLNLNFSTKRTKVRLTCASAPNQGGSSSNAGNPESGETTTCDDDRKMFLQAALVRIMKQRKVLRHAELVQEAAALCRGSFAPSVALVKKCIEALIDKQYLERSPGTLDTYSYLA